WDVGYYSNATVTTNVLNVFICPSDGVSPIHAAGLDLSSGATNNYYASAGSSTDFGNPNGLFAEFANCYGLQACTDGSSNTVAFGDALVGTQNVNPPNVKWRTGPVLGDPSALCAATQPTPKNCGWYGVYDVSKYYTAVLADLQTCEQGWVTQTGK